MFFGVPPPNQDPRYEGEFGKRTPGQRLEGFAYGICVITLLLVIAVVVLSLT